MPCTYTSPPSGEVMISVAFYTTSAVTAQPVAAVPTHVAASNDHVRSATRGSALTRLPRCAPTYSARPSGAKRTGPQPSRYAGGESHTNSRSPL